MSSIVSVTEKIDGPRTTSIDLLWRRSYKRTFTVETNSPKVGSFAVRTATGIPQPGNYYTNGLSSGDADYEYDYGAWVSGIEASMDSGSGGVQWTVSVDYSPFDTSIFGQDPTLWPIKVSFGGERTDRVIYFDRYGNPLTNSAGDPFDPPITIDDSRSIMTVTRNERVSAFSLALAELYRDTINAYTWNGFGPYTVKLGIISTSEPQYDSAHQVYYYTVTYPFMVNRDGWLLKILDAGCNELSGAYGAFYPYTNQYTRPIIHQGQPVSDPVALNGFGQELQVGDIPVVLTFDGYDKVDFSGLNINLSLALGM